MLKKFFIIIYFVLLWNLSFSYASVIFTEIMYNPEGSDTGREWIEIYNSGNSTVDIGSWYFYEADTYHGLHPDGFTDLGGGERALIVSNIESAQSDLGSQNYIKSSFSLNNTSEELVLADSDKNHVDSYTYHVDDGANGDGNSLQLVDSSWVSADPTPGSANSSSDSSDNSSNNNSSSSNSSSNSSEEGIQYPDPYYTARLNLPQVIVAQNDFEISAEVIHTKRSESIRKLRGYYYVNLGDGNIIESDKRIDSQYRYRNPGDYTLVFEYYSSRLSYEAGEDPDALITKNIFVSPHEIRIVRVNAFEGVVLENNTSTKISLDSWKLLWNNYEYSFPRHSYLNGGGEMKVIFSTLGFSPEPSLHHPIQLVSNAYKPVSYFPRFVQKNKVVKKEQTENTSTTEWSTFDDLPDADENFFGEKDSYLDQYLYENPNKIRIDFNENSLQSKPQSKQNNSIYYALGSLILMLGAARFARQKNKKDQNKETRDLGTIEIIE